MTISYYPPLGASGDTPITVNFQGTTGTDAFGRLRTSNPLTMLDCKNVGSKNELFDENIINNATVTYSQNKSQVNLNVTQAAGDKVIRQTFRRMSYQPGKSLLIMNTFVMNEQTENLLQSVGYYDDYNGVIFQDEGTHYQITLRSYASGSVVNTSINQADWNGDKLDGTGPSGITLDVTKTQIFFCDLEWLGVGSVRVGFVIDGLFVLAHTFHNANFQTAVYMTSANLPIRYEIEVNDTLATGTYTMGQICSTAISEGGYQPEGIRYNVGTSSISGVTLANADTWYNVVSIRIAANRPNAIIVPSGLDVLNISNSDLQWALFKNATPTTPFSSWTSFNDNVDYELTTVDLATTGTTVAGGYVTGKSGPVLFYPSSVPFSYQIGIDLGGLSDVMTLAVKTNSSNSNVAGLLKWFDV